MHTICTARRLIILLTIAMFSDTICGNVSPVAMWAAVSGTPPKPEGPVRRSASSGGGSAADDEYEKKKKEELKEKNRLLLIYEKDEADKIDFFSKEIKAKSDLLSLIYQINSLLKSGYVDKPSEGKVLIDGATGGDDEAYEQAFKREKMGELENLEKHNMLHLANIKFLASLEELRINTQDIQERFDIIKYQSAKVVVSEKNKSVFDELMQKLDHTVAHYSSECDGRVIVSGDPGNGKTAIGKQLALDNDCDFIKISVPGLINSFQNSGSGAAIEKLKHALARSDRTGKPVVIGWDEVDAVLRNHSSEQGQVYRSTAQTFLIKLDDLMYDPRIIWYCTTNFPKALHEAFLSRFSSANAIHLGNPNASGRKQLFEKFLKDKRITDKIPQTIVDKLVKDTNKLGNRDIESIVKSLSKELKRSDGKVVVITKDQCWKIIQVAREKALANAVKNEEYYKKVDEWLGRYNSATGAIIHTLQLAGYATTGYQIGAEYIRPQPQRFPPAAPPPVG